MFSMILLDCFISDLVSSSSVFLISGIINKNYRVSFYLCLISNYYQNMCFKKKKIIHASFVLFLSPEKIFYFQGKKKLSEISICDITTLVFITLVTSERLKFLNIFLFLSRLLTLFRTPVFLN